MKENYVLSIPFYEFDCDATLVEEVFEEVKQLDFTANEKNAISMGPSFYNERLFVWFDECLEQVRKKYYIDSVKLDIVACWANRTNITQSHHFHKHPNSIVSAVFYLTEGEGGETCFFTKDPWLQYTEFLNIDKEQDAQRRLLKTILPPRKGLLRLFPSSVEHTVAVHKSRTPRYTISFNTFVSGDLSNGNNSTILTIKSETVAEKEKVKKNEI
jgi:hypothetical protein